MSVAMSSIVLYLRTDICGTPINVGGSIGHTLGVINTLKKSHTVIVFSSAMHQVLDRQQDVIFFSLNVYKIFFFMTDKIPLFWRWYYLRWRLECIFSNVFFVLQILLKIKRSKLHFIYQRYSVLNCTGVILSKIKKTPLVLEYNGSEAYWFNPLSTAPWWERWAAFKRLSYWVEDLNLKHARQIVAVSQALKDDLVARGADQKKILVNPNGVEEELFNEACLMQERQTIRQWYGLEEENFVFGFIGTFGHWHGIPMLEKIIPIICDNYKHAKFLLIGDGSLKASLEDVLREYIKNGSVILTGKIEQHRAPEYLAACDAFLCPTAPNADGTRFFGSPTKLFEYMSMAKPVIASDLEQLSEVLAPALKISEHTSVVKLSIRREAGILVSPLDVQGFVKACELCLSMPEEDRKKLGENAREKVLAQYTWSKHVERIMEKFKELQD